MWQSFLYVYLAFLVVVSSIIIRDKAVRFQTHKCLHDDVSWLHSVTGCLFCLITFEKERLVRDQLFKATIE